MDFFPQILFLNTFLLNFVQKYWHHLDIQGPSSTKILSNMSFFTKISEIRAFRGHIEFIFWYFFPTSNVFINYTSVLWKENGKNCSSWAPQAPKYSKIFPFFNQILHLMALGGHDNLRWRIFFQKFCFCRHSSIGLWKKNSKNWKP